MGYHQTIKNPDSIPVTVFSTRYDHVEFVILPFSLSNASATFMSLMSKVFGNESDKYFNVYLEGISVYSKTLKNHLGHQEIVLKRLSEKKLYGKISKCEFAVKQVEYLGQLI